MCEVQQDDGEGEMSNRIETPPKTDKQKRLERQGCMFSGQELLDNHELDPDKECYCGRPLRAPE